MGNGQKNRPAGFSEDALEAKRHFAVNLDAIVHATGVGLWDWDLRTGKIVHSGVFERIAGYEEGELPGNDPNGRTKLIYIDDRARADAAIEACVSGKTDSYEMEFRIVCKDGAVKWVQDRGAVVERDDSGRAVRLAGMLYDVNRFKHAEASLEEKAESAAKDLETVRRTSVAMFDANPYMSLLFDDTFAPVDCNPTLMQYFGYTEKDALLRDIMGILHGAIPQYQPGGQKSIPMEQRFRDTVKTGYINFETVFHFGDKAVPMGIIMKRIDYMGSFAIVVYQRDLTTIKKTEQALLYQEGLLQTANTVAALLMETDAGNFLSKLSESLRLLATNLGADRAYIWKNHVEDGALCASQLYEWIAEDGPGYLEYGKRSFRYDDVLPEWRALVRDTASVNAPVRELPESVKRFSGLTDVQAVLLVPIMLQDEFWGFLGFDDCRNEDRVFSAAEERIMRSAGMLIGSAVLRHDMMENLLTAKEAALAASRAKSDFLSRMSHEIRTPMHAIIGMTAIAKRTEDVPRMQYCLDKIDAASHQLLELINDVLDMSKIEANKLTLTENEFSFEQMLQNVLHVINVKIEEKNLELSVELLKMFERTVIADELRLSQVLINLLDNAAKFTPENGPIAVRIDYTAGAGDAATLHVEVRDGGIGISAAQQEKLFTAFEQADGGTTRQYGGSGLGLVICKSIVRLMGGDIHVESELGKGSCFAFDVNIRFGAQLALARRMPPPGVKPHVLIVDDSEDALDYLSSIVAPLAGICDIAQDGQQALKLARAAMEAGAPYDIALVDWRMPGMNGTETVAEMKKITGEHTTFIMISVADKTDVEQDIKLLGVRYFLSKPILPSTLQDTICMVMEGTHKDEKPRGYDWAGKCILLVEDIAVNREVVLGILEDTGVVIECACDGVEAVELFSVNGDRYDLVLMDIQMPRMDGLDATRGIRASKNPGSRNVPIIAMTANAFKEDVDLCLAAGMDGHIAKPVDMDELYRTLAMYLED